MSIFKACDVRGIVGKEWDVADARRIGWAIGRMLARRDQSSIVIGGDFRRSTPRLKQALSEGLLRTGMRVVDVGQVATPVVQFAARQNACPNWAIVTASHNPGKYNGIKFLLDGWPSIPRVIDELQESLSPEPDAVPGGHLSEREVVRDYVPWVVQFSNALVRDASPTCAAAEGANQAVPQGTSLRVAVDPMGGAFTGVAADALTQAGDQVTVLDAQLDRDFTRRDPDPSKDANVSCLAQSVQQAGADLGLALDGDGDRVIFVDERGTIVRPEQIACLLIQRVFGKCTVVHDLKCASILEREIVRRGGTAIMQPSGHGFIKTKMLQQQAELGVEVSGHHFFGALSGGDDGLLTGLIVLELLRMDRRTFSELLAPFGWPAITPDLRVPFAGDVQEVLRTIASTCGGRVTRLDGVRAQYEQLGWALARASITEPAITFRVEGRDPRCVRTIVERFLASTPELKRQVLERIS